MTRKKVGLALSGGAARGFAHLGVLKVLVAHGIPIDFIAGTSAGSFAGGAFASGLSVEQIIEIGKESGWLKLGKFAFSAKGLLSNAPMGEIIKAKFPHTRFEDLPIPFAAVVCDLETGDEIVLKEKGDVAFAIRASCAIPGVFVPLEDERGRILIDGGAVAPVPTKAVRKMGAEIIIAVDVIADPNKFGGVPTTLLGVFIQSAMIMLRTASKMQHYRAHVVMTPKVGHLRPDELGKMYEFIQLGEEAALEKIEEIKKLVFET
jgi:NTE family protein